MSTVTKEEALQLLKGSSKYSHSIMVSKIMRALARRFGEDEDEWELVGLLHDLDYDLVHGDMSQHGVKASEMLKGKLSESSLHAIKAHDHRTGVEPETLLDESLIFADSLAVLMEDQAIDVSSEASEIEDALREEAAFKPWISENIFAYSSRRGISILQVLQTMLDF